MRKILYQPFAQLLIFSLILISVVCTLMDVSLPQDSLYALVFQNINMYMTFLFAVELLLRLLASNTFKEFISDCYIDIIALLPVARPLRMFRFLNFIRLIKWVQRSHRLKRSSALLSIVLGENLQVIIYLLVIFLTATVLIMEVERNNQSFNHLGNAAWWSLFTLMAGEPVMGEPKTLMGRAITVFVMLGGFTLFAMITGMFSALMANRLRQDSMAKDKFLDMIHDHLVICGWSRAAPSLIRELRACKDTSEIDLVVVCELEHEPQLDLPNSKLLPPIFIHDDFTAAAALERVHVGEAVGAIILADQTNPNRTRQDRDARTILAALTIEKMAEEDPNRAPDEENPDVKDIYTCVELLNWDEHQVKVLRGSCVEDVFSGDKFVGHLLAHAVHNPGLLQILDELLSAERGSLFYSTPVEPLDTTYEQALLRMKRQSDWDAIVIGISRRARACVPPCEVRGASQRKIILNPPLYEPLLPEDLLILVMPASRLNRRLRTYTIRKPSYNRSTVRYCSHRNIRHEGDNQHCLICGWNQAATKIIEELIHYGSWHITVLAEPELPPPEWPHDMENANLLYKPGDFASSKCLQPFKHIDMAIMLADKMHSRSDQDRDARTILAALTLHKLNPNIELFVELLNRDVRKERVLEVANVDNIVVGDEYIGNLMAHATRTPGLAEAVIELLTTQFGNEFKIIRACDYDVAGAAFIDALVRHKQEHEELILAVESTVKPACCLREGADEVDGNDRKFWYLVNPPPNYVIRKDDRLFVITRCADEE